MISFLFNTLEMRHGSLLQFFCFLLPNVVLGVVALGIKREAVLGVEVALGVGVVPGSLLVVDGGVGAVMLVGVDPGALLLVETVAAVVVLAVRGAEKPVLDECDVDGSRTAHPRPSNDGRRVDELG